MVKLVNTLDLGSNNYKILGVQVPFLVVLIKQLFVK